jgi:hypothetical protein
MRAPIELFSHSALVFLLGFAARIVVLVLCMHACFFWVFGVVVLQLQMKLLFVVHAFLATATNDNGPERETKTETKTEPETERDELEIRSELGSRF